jgi:hypothetical protein
MPPAAFSRNLVLTLFAAAACAKATHTLQKTTPAHSRYGTDFRRIRPLTRAERSGFRETSHYADVVRFVDSLKVLGAKIAVGSIGKTAEGREIPYVVASRPVVSTPQEARRLNRPIVYVQANIHAGEVEGKEALQSLLRDLVFDAGGENALDSIVLVAVPIYNADGNERFASQDSNRSEQNGPDQVGRRANAQGLDLNRDYVKAEAPETRGALAMFAAWDPDVFVDLHATDGSFHGYALTYAPPLNPAARFTAAFTRDTMLLEIRRRMRVREGFETFDYGNLVSQDSAERGWFTYDSRPRFGTNYYGLRGRIAVLGEAYSHDPFARRVAATYDFVAELLSWVAENAEDVTDHSREADRRTADWGHHPASAPAVPLRARLTTAPRLESVMVEEVVRTDEAARSEPGVPRGLRRTGLARAVRMPVYDRFEATVSRAMPYAYAFPPDAGAALRPLLALHGIATDVVQDDGQANAQAYTVDSAVKSATAFQGHLEERVFGRWADPQSRPLSSGTYIVRTAQPLGILAAYLLEPDSEDGATTWNVLDPFIRQGAQYPIVRIVQPITVRLRPGD